MPKANTAAVLASNRLHLALIGASVSAGGSCYYGRVAAASAESPQNSLLNRIGQAALLNRRARNPPLASARS